VAGAFALENGAQVTRAVVAEGHRVVDGLMGRAVLDTAEMVGVQQAGGEAEGHEKLLENGRRRESRTVEPISP
jgi:hypothetical protein